MSSNNNNEVKEDFLEVDPKIPGQNYVCLSFVSPEKFLKQKENYYPLHMPVAVSIRMPEEKCFISHPRQHHG